MFVLPFLSIHKEMYFLVLNRDVHLEFLTQNKTVWKQGMKGTTHTKVESTNHKKLYTCTAMKNTSSKSLRY